METLDTSETMEAMDTFESSHPLDHAPLFASYDSIQSEKTRKAQIRDVPRNALQAYLHSSKEAKTGSGFQRIQRCREALEALDRQGWQRSFHQRLFHDHFIRACARIFWKTEKPGSFARDHQKILEMNGWDHLSQEILVSTPRRLHDSLPLLFPAFCHGCMALQAEVLKVYLLGVWYASAARFTLPSATHAEKDVGYHHAVQILPLYARVHQQPCIEWR